MLPTAAVPTIGRTLLDLFFCPVVTVRDLD
uniref:Uncharacterized protein n=1 Tax=Anguilla anguilla TaxID=7936 RepID=A0A0E9QXY4_ANGAN